MAIPPEDEDDDEVSSHGSLSEEIGESLRPFTVHLSCMHMHVHMYMHMHIHMHCRWLRCQFFSSVHSCETECVKVGSANHNHRRQEIASKTVFYSLC